MAVQNTIDVLLRENDLYVNDATIIYGSRGLDGFKLVHDVDFGNGGGVGGVLDIGVENGIISGVDSVEDDFRSVGQELNMKIKIEEYILHNGVVHSTIQVLLSLLLDLTHDGLATFLGGLMG